MPGAVPRTSTYGLTNATFPYIRSIASLGLNEALSKDIHLQSGLSIYRQKLTCSAVGSSQNRSYENAEAVLMH